MELKAADPRALKNNPNPTRRTKASPQEEAVLLAAIKAVGVLIPPVVFADPEGNGYIIEMGHRRVKHAIAAELKEIRILVVDASSDNGALRSFIENVARAALSIVDQWRAIEDLVTQGWNEQAIADALALPLRQVRKLRLLAKVLPAMLDQMARGDMPNGNQLRIISAASTDEQAEVWKAHKPKKGDTVQWFAIANALNKKRMFARDASFGDDLAAAYRIEWTEDLFAPADQDSRYTTNVEAFLGAQHEWMTSNLPKHGAIVDLNTWGEPDLPKKAERVHGKPQKSDHIAMYLNHDGRVKSVVYRLPEAKKPKGKAGATASGADEGADGQVVVSTPRPDVTQRGHDIIGDLRTDALREALGRAPIEDDMLMALLVLAFAGVNVTVHSPSRGDMTSSKRFMRHAAMLFDGDGKLSFDRDTLRVAARSALIDVLSCRRGYTNSGVLAQVAGDAIAADSFIANMGTKAFLECLSRQALEAVREGTAVELKARVRDTRAELVKHFKDARFVHPAALFAPELKDLAEVLKAREVAEVVDEDPADDQPGVDGDPADDRLEGGAPGEVADPLPGSDPADVVEEDETAYSVAAE